jgi:1-deoxyxylulose-5-phosphate synthase
MEHRKLGRSGLEVSRICLGAMNFGTPGWGCDRDAAAAIVAVHREAGGSVFDTADVYGAGASEQILGDLLRGARDEVVVATKVGLSLTPGPNRAGMSAKHIRTSVEASLRRLGTDYIDLYQLHNYDTAVPLEESLTAMDDLVRAGKVRYVGCSNYFAWQIAEAMGTAASRGLTGLVSAQMMYNLIRRDIEREHVECAARFGVGLIAYGPLHSGMLGGGWTYRMQIPACISATSRARSLSPRRWSKLPTRWASLRASSRWPGSSAGRASHPCSPRPNVPKNCRSS